MVQQGKQQDTGLSINVSADIERFRELGLLKTLLLDRSSGQNLVWATSLYAYRGESFQPSDEILVGDVTGRNRGVVCTRASKERSEAAALTKAHAEVFTPTWVCKLMIDEADKAWHESLQGTESSESWQDYVASTRLEITCGEAPYLVNRYDAADGAPVALEDRIGILDRKLALVCEHVTTREDWIAWALVALKSTYGYEYQGDNLLIARTNTLCTLEDYAASAGYAPFDIKDYREFAKVISWNLWQMDGLTDCVPFGATSRQVGPPQDMLPGFDEFFAEAQPEEEVNPKRSVALIYDWKKKTKREYRSLKEKGSLMKFDYVIGNPPYQEEIEGTSDKPIYDRFMDASFEVSDRVELISPARFLFNAGKTPKEWNRKMLGDRHFKVIGYYQNSQDVFPSNDIKGGIAITYRDSTRDYGAINTFSAFEELNTILHKVLPHVREKSLDDSIFQQTKWNLDALYKAHPEYRAIIGSGGNERRLTTSIFTTVDCFRTSEQDGDLQILGLINNVRHFRYIDADFIDRTNSNIESYKVIVPKSNGTGAIGEVLSTPLIGEPLIGEPLIGYTQSFISFGSFDNKSEASALLKYIKSRFARTLLGTLKITQDNNKGTWVNVPLQDFTSNSDIDWSKSVAEIDMQFYKKYGLSKEEIDFIETHVKEMD